MKTKERRRRRSKIKKQNEKERFRPTPFKLQSSHFGKVSGDLGFRFETSIKG
jgi:hypothetical protein